MSKHDPKPLIEEHYHVQELIRQQERRVEERTYHRNREKEKAERQETIDKAPMYELKDFHCLKCKEDFISPAIKQSETDWNNANQRIAFYRTKHMTCGTWSSRLVTDSFSDHYWSRSRKVSAQRGKHYADLLQPFQNGYNLHYGKQ